MTGATVRAEWIPLRKGGLGEAVDSRARYRSKKIVYRRECV
jgi:hypothetical protein